MIGGLFVGVTFTSVLPTEQPNEIIKQMVTEIEESLHAEVRVQLHEAYEDKEADGISKGDYYLTYYVEESRPEYTKELVDMVADRLSVLAKEKVYGRIENPYEELRGLT